jgi:hypothetical protein
MGMLTNLIYNLQFKILSLLQSVLKFSISDFAFLRMCALLIYWEKLFNFLTSFGPPGSADHRLRTAGLDYHLNNQLTY